jgi:uncharacterized alpha-E superfamily protein
MLGTTPAWDGEALRPKPFVMRLFVAWHDGEYRVMPGGLTRFDPTGADAIVSLQRGSATKDTWVLANHASDDSLQMTLHQPLGGYQRPESTPSRLADNLYWLGRYLERTGQMVRLLDQLDPLLRDEVAALEPAVALDSLRILLVAQAGWGEEDATMGELATQIRVQADDPDHPGSLASNLAQLIRVLDQVKVNLPPEFWRILRRLRSIAAQGHPHLESDFGQQLATIEALCNETLAHDTGWRFLKLGRRIERSRQLVFLAEEFLVPEPVTGVRPAPPSEFRLQTLLHFTDCLFSYKGIYHGIYQPASILAWLIASPENPRGLRFQAERIAEHVASLPEELAPRAVSGLRATAARLVGATKSVHPSALASDPELAQEFFDEARSILSELNDRLTQVYFSHSDVQEALRGT